MKKKRKSRKPIQSKRKPAKKRGRVSSKKSKSQKVVRKKRKPAKKKFQYQIKKRRGHAIYDIALGSRFKTEQEIEAIISSLQFSTIKESNEFVKVTFFEQKGNEKQAFTDLDEYSYDDLPDFRQKLKQKMLDQNYTFHRTPASKAPNYWKKMYRLRNYLTKIIIDIETAD